MQYNINEVKPHHYFPAWYVFQKEGFHCSEIMFFFGSVVSIIWKGKLHACSHASSQHNYILTYTSISVVLNILNNVSLSRYIGNFIHIGFNRFLKEDHIDWNRYPKDEYSILTYCCPSSTTSLIELFTAVCLKMILDSCQINAVLPYVRGPHNMMPFHGKMWLC